MKVVVMELKHMKMIVIVVDWEMYIAQWKRNESNSSGDVVRERVGCNRR